MKHKILLMLTLGFAITASAQYKNDNVLFKTVDPGDLCATLQQNKGYLLLDVRSAGENCDTSQSINLNIGKLKGAKNIDVGELGKRLSEIADYKNQPVFVYCSHSQRSRRASKMLADSGFTNVHNINGGMTAIYYAQAGDKACLPEMLQTNNKYSIISAADLCVKMSGKDQKVFVVDVRPDSAFRHISTDAKVNAIGTLKGSASFPFADFHNMWTMVPRDKEIVLVDLYGQDAPRAASILLEHGFKNVSILIEGMGRWIATDPNELSCSSALYKSPVGFELFSTPVFGAFTRKNNDYILLDVRSAEEFGNKHSDYWRNIGKLKNAINIPVSEINNRIMELEQYKDKTIITYGFSGGPEAFTAAANLYSKGFTKVKVLVSGVFNVRWTAYNRKDQGYLKDLVTDVPEINW